MKEIVVWSIEYREGNLQGAYIFFNSQEEASKVCVAHNTTLPAKTTLRIYDEADEYNDGISDKAIKQVLTKLNKAERIVLGLKG